jgi:hypothetical protein
LQELLGRTEHAVGFIERAALHPVDAPRVEMFLRADADDARREGTRGVADAGCGGPHRAPGRGAAISRDHREGGELEPLVLVQRRLLDKGRGRAAGVTTQLLPQRLLRLPKGSEIPADVAEEDRLLHDMPAVTTVHAQRVVQHPVHRFRLANDAVTRGGFRPAHDEHFVGFGTCEPAHLTG